MNIHLTLRSSRPEVFCKKLILRNFAKFTGKHLCQSLFFNKVAGLMRKKGDSGTGVFCEFCEISKNIFFIEHLQWLLLNIVGDFSRPKYPYKYTKYLQMLDFSISYFKIGYICYFISETYHQNGLRARWIAQGNRQILHCNLRSLIAVFQRLHPFR